VPPRIAMVSGASRTSAPLLLDENGQRINAPRLSMPALRQLPPNVKPRPWTTGPVALPALSKGPALVDEDTSTDWVDRYVVTQRGAARLRARLSKEADKVESANGQSRFVRTRKGESSEILLDSSTGAVQEVRASQNGKLRAITVRGYEKDAHGHLVLSTERVTRYSDKANQAPVTITTNYKNIRTLEAR
jgi:hypothetical protein